MKVYLVLLLLAVIIEVRGHFREGVLQRREKKSHHRKKMKQEDMFQKVSQEFLLEDNKQIDEQGFYTIFSEMGLTLGEVKYIFNIIDIDHDLHINKNEYQNFLTIFVEPFQACDTDSLHSLDAEKIKAETCKYTPFEGEQPQLHIDAKEATDQVLIYLGMAKTLNFWGFVVIKKILLSFEKCGQNRALSRIDIKCAFKILSKRRIIVDSDGYESFRISTYMREGVDHGYDQLLNFKEYLMVGVPYLVYTEFGFIRNEESVNKREVLQSMDEGKLPNALDRASVDAIYDNKQTIQYGQFAVGYTLHRLFLFFDTDFDQKWSENEFQDFMNYEYVNKWIKLWIDSFNLPSQEQIDALDQKENSKYTETDYLAYSRRRLAHHHSHSLPKRTHKKSQESQEIEPNEANRKLMYEMFCNSPLGEFRFANLFNFYRLSYAFIMNDKNHSGLLAIAEIRLQYLSYTKQKAAYLQLKDDQMAVVSQLVAFYNEVQMVQVNIKQYLTFFTMQAYLQLKSVSSVTPFLGKAELKTIGEERFGLKFTDHMFSSTKVDVDKKNLDHNDPDQSIYDGTLCYRMALKYEVLALRQIKIKGERRLKRRQK